MLTLSPFKAGLARLVLTAAPIALAFPAPAFAKPAVFSDLAYKDALAKAKNDGRILLVDATAVWCGPCKVMDRTTWVDEAVVKWIGEHAIAIQVDVDEESDLAQSLKIEAMPTIIAYREGTEFDRIVGLRQPQPFLAWVEGVQRGESSRKAPPGQAGDRSAPDGRANVKTRYDLARGLVEKREFEKATEEYLWLWSHGLEHDPSFVGVRLSFMVGEMQRLSQQHEPAKRTFTHLRDVLEARLKAGEAGMPDLTDWVSLNQVVGDEARTLEWFDRVKDDPAARSSIRRASLWLQQLLEERERWADLGRLHDDPLSVARQRVALRRLSDRADVSESQRSKIRTAQDESLREDLSRLYACCLVADRAGPAEEIAGALLTEQDSAAARHALVRWALRVDRPLERHLRWLDEAAAKGDPDNSLRERLTAALKR